MGTVGPAEVLLLLFVLLSLTTACICILKGKRIMAVISLILGLGIISTVGASRLAKPRSYWARRFYDPPKLERAMQRYGIGGSEA